ncbi:Cupin 2 conserved barrel domain protein [uncultured Woeseiaceae bacterium]|uniref:Cupin 2 conserved barrel domain protein n=1 Tax=uncultured Woeseiaceae bacterium TaxID=1983305 RepID=A0A7D9D1T0_9GAMM|nr:Cupin 2 conserved barrel domain protein [uncultured Woeseiaceae bacterium]
MSRYFLKEHLTWEQAPVRGGTVMDKSVVWEGDYDTRSAFFSMPKGMIIPRHTHPQWVQVMVLEGTMEVESDEDGKVRIDAGGCYFVETGDTHLETAIEDTLVLVTQGEDRPEFLNDTAENAAK